MNYTETWWLYVEESVRTMVSHIPFYGSLFLAITFLGQFAEDKGV